MQPFGIPGWLSSKESPASAGDLGSIHGAGRFPGRVNGNSLQYSCLGNPSTEESGRLHSPEGCRVIHDLVTDCACVQPVNFFSENQILHVLFYTFLEKSFTGAYFIYHKIYPI